MIQKIQIRSFVKGGNHGQYLQALGMVELIRKIMPNAEVSHLDYENHFFDELIIQVLSGHLLKFLSMRYFWIKRFKFSGLGSNPDLSVYGSDMIWHLDSNLFSPDPIFFSYRDSALFKIAFAPSIGCRTSIEPNWISELLRGFKKFGVRDRNTAMFVKDHCSADADLVIDPCFFLLKSKYAPLFKNKLRANFISVYGGSPIKLVRCFHKNLHLDLLPRYIRNVKYFGYFPKRRFMMELRKQLKDPLWTLGEIAKSKLLITSTFHGVMMALMTRTPFIAVKNPNLIVRLDNPISEIFSPKRFLSMDELICLSNKDLDLLLLNDDFNMGKLEKYILYSEKWLRKAILQN